MTTTPVVSVEILQFSPEYRNDFRRINEAWIKKHFTIEPIDEQVLNNPEEFILKDGGQVLFAKNVDTEEVLGTCALMKHADGQFELTKMGVTESARGQKIGEKLCQTAIDWAKAKGLPSLMLETNSSLKPAIALYEKLGFKHVPIDTPSDYARADVRMILTFHH